MADVRRLNVKKVRGLIEPGRYFDGEGLYLEVLSPTNRSWLLRYQLHGKEHWMGGGSALLFSLPDAREWAREQHRLLARGIDPLTVRREERAQAAAAAAKARTFEQVTTEYFNAHADSWSVKHRSDFTGSMRDHVHKTLGELPVASIDDPLVLDVLKPVWSTKTETAKRIRARVEAVLDFAVSAGYRPAGNNPARWKGHLENLLAKPDKIATVKHHEATALHD